jgi:SET domain-containing protein
MATPVKRPTLVRQRSTLHGYGVFTREPITKNTRIIAYEGELIANRESEAREERYLADGCIWVFRINRAWSRDATIGGNISRYINHSCRPNCWIEIVDTTIWIRASKSIRKGDELTFDYSTDGKRTIRCRCRPGCTNML